MEIYGITYCQGEQKYITTVMPMKFILNNYEVLVYGEDPIYGYQRDPKIKHYSKIAKELISDINSQVTPSSIILGINQEDIDKVFNIREKFTEGNFKVLELDDNDNTGTVKLRVIDGQHRIKGFEKAIEESRKNGNINFVKKLEEYATNVIIMILNSNKRKPEVTVFSNINAKAKPLKMDLTLLAEYQYSLKEEDDDVSEIDYLVITVIKELNTGEYCKEWKNGIILDVNSQRPIGSVGFKTFYESIRPLCKKYIDTSSYNWGEMDFLNKKSCLDQLAKQCAEDIGKCWNVVFSKWYTGEEQLMYDGEELVNIYYNENYYLQRTMGVLAINHIIVNSYENPNSYEIFRSIIESSNLVAEDWNVKARFAGLSSKSGVSIIEKAIKNIKLHLS